MNNLILLREHKRHQIHRPVTLERWTTNAPESGMHVDHAPGRDISSSGIGLMPLQPLDIGEFVKLEISLNNDVSLPVFAETVWCLEDTDGYKAGLRFLT